jgi:hypothetical protein
MNTILGFLLTLAVLGSDSCVPISESSTSDSYRWVKAIDTGVQSWPRWVMPVNGPDHQLLMITKERTWVSIDGKNWDSKPNNANTAARHGVSQVYFKGKYWLMGGMDDWAHFTNEIWTSDDGFNWKLITSNAPWGPRRDALLVEFQNKLWLLGGSESSGKRDVLPQRRHRDVWQSPDGVTWTKLVAELPDGNEKLLVFRDQLLLLGKFGVFTSPDGLSWRQTTNGKPFSAVRAFGAVVYDGRLWVFGGIGIKKTVNDVWSSSDGIRWTQHNNAPWFRRGGEYSIVFDGKLWLYGGKTGEDYKHADDVWYMTKPTSPMGKSVRYPLVHP